MRNRLDLRVALKNGAGHLGLPGQPPVARQRPRAPFAPLAIRARDPGPGHADRLGSKGADDFPIPMPVAIPLRTRALAFIATAPERSLQFLLEDRFDEIPHPAADAVLERIRPVAPDEWRSAVGLGSLGHGVISFGGASRRSWLLQHLEITPPSQFPPTPRQNHEISGKIQKDTTRGGESGFAIFVNSGHPAVRRRFTIAHEIAHYVLHERKIGDGIFDDALYRSGLPHQEKVQANALAADILMPRDRVREMQRLHGDNINYLANLFWVSEQAMSIRLGVPT
ncbi:hypothetical protein DQW77_17790 [Roseovarius sp. TE539]|nr:hypothetical protein DQW77_17790 [Roseovarius sp. TE539]